MEHGRPGGRDQDAALARWWASLGEGERALVLSLAPGTALPAPVAAVLLRHGVHVPGAAVAWDLGGVQVRTVVHVQPLALTAFLDALRAVPAAA